MTGEILRDPLSLLMAVSKGHQEPGTISGWLKGLFDSRPLRWTDLNSRS